MPLGVTVLTSEPEATAHLLHQRVGVGLEAGCGGFVCAVPDIAAVRQLAPRRAAGDPGHPPRGRSRRRPGPRARRPRQALDAGADLLVVGRPVTRADDPVAAARALAASLV